MRGALCHNAIVFFTSLTLTLSPQGKRKVYVLA
jgi:hypothetical protein